MREEEQDAEEYGGGKQRCDGPHDEDVFGPDDLETLKMRWRYAIVLGHTENATHEDHIKAVATLEDVVRRCRRVLGLGTNNPMTANAERALAEARDLLSKS